MGDAGDLRGRSSASWGVYVWATAIALPAVAAIALLGWRSDRGAEQGVPPDAEEEHLEASARPTETDAPLESPAPLTGTKMVEIAKVKEGAGEHREAEAIYSSAARKLGGSDEAYEAAVAAAELNRLELKNAGRALKFYRQAKGLRPDGAHRERVLIGLGLTAQELGDELQEVRAWSELLAKFPHSDHAGQAEQRLAQARARSQSQVSKERAPVEAESPVEASGETPSSAARPNSF